MAQDGNNSRPEPRGEAHLHADRIDAARAQAKEALEHAVSRGERGTQAWILRLLADIAMHSEASGTDEALRSYRQALELAGDLGMRPLVARCHLGLARLRRRTGDRAKTEEHIATATTMCLEMGMRGWEA